MRLLSVIIALVALVRKCLRGMEMVGFSDRVSSVRNSFRRGSGGGSDASSIVAERDMKKLVEKAEKLIEKGSWKELEKLLRKSKVDLSEYGADGAETLVHKFMAKVGPNIDYNLFQSILRNFTGLGLVLFQKNADGGLPTRGIEDKMRVAEDRAKGKLDSLRDTFDIFAVDQAFRSVKNLEGKLEKDDKYVSYILASATDVDALNLNSNVIEERINDKLDSLADEGKLELKASIKDAALRLALVIRPLDPNDPSQEYRLAINEFKKDTPVCRKYGGLIEELAKEQLYLTGRANDLGEILLCAINIEDIDAVKALVDGLGADVNYEGSDITPLELAASAEHPKPDLVKYLAQAGASRKGLDKRENQVVNDAVRRARESAVPGRG